MDRLILTDAQWAKMEPHCLGKPTDPGRTGSDNRMFLEAVLWIARIGGPWRDLPKEFGNWNTAFTRYCYWVKAGVFKRIFDAVSEDPDMEYAMVDGTIVKVHRFGQGAKGGPKARRSVALGAVRRRRFWRSPMRWAIWSASCCCRDSATTRLAWRR
jgi:transposase